jgi:hypothetical protein
MKPAAGGVAGGAAKVTPTGDSQHAQATGSSSGSNANNNAHSSSCAHEADGHGSPQMRNTATALSVAVLALKNPGWEGMGNLTESNTFEAVRVSTSPDTRRRWHRITRAVTIVHIESSQSE